MTTLAPAFMLIPIALVLVLVVSALAKLQAPASTANSVRLLRLPEALKPDFVAKALPPGELVLAAGMLSPWLPLARLAAMAALVLFVVYLVIIARAMTFDPRPSCGCFGQIGDQRVTWKTVFRNTLLVAGAAAFVWMTWAEASTAYSLISGESGWLLLLLGAYLALVLWLIVAPPNYGDPWWHRWTRKREPAQAHVHGQEDDEPDEEEYVRLPIPDNFLLDKNRNPVHLRELVRERPALLLFVNCGCPSTRELWTRLEGYAERLPAVQVLGVETRQFGDLGVPGVKERLFYDPMALAWAGLRIQGTSSAVLLGADGWLAGGPVAGNDEVEQFVEDIAEALADAAALDETVAGPKTGDVTADNPAQLS